MPAAWREYLGPVWSQAGLIHGQFFQKIFQQHAKGNSQWFKCLTRVLGFVVELKIARTVAGLHLVGLGSLEVMGT